MLELKDVVIRLQGKTLLNLTGIIGAGECLTIMGASGSGKSTLLTWLVGQLDKNFEASGRVILNGADVTGLPTEARKIGLMYQDPLLFPHLTVAQNIAFGMATSANNHRVIKDMLNKVGLYDMHNRMPATLSGGQQSRVALLRLLASQPQAVLLDEPFSRLDENNKQHTRRFVFDQLRKANIPMMQVTHDMTDAKAAGGEVIAMESLC